MVKAVIDHFDEYAKHGSWQSLYEKGGTNFSVSFELRYLKFTDFLEETQPQSVLDAGCGSGDFVSAMPKSVQVYRGIDFSGEMISAAQKRSPPVNGRASRNLELSFEQADILKYDPELKFDFVLASGLTEYFDAIEPVFEKLFALTKAGGVAAVQTPNRKFYRWQGQAKIYSDQKGFAHHRASSAELDKFAEDAGFEKIKGDFVNHHIIPFSANIGWLHKSFDRLFGGVIPDGLSQTRASMYIGLYRKPAK